MGEEEGQNVPVKVKVVLTKRVTNSAVEVLGFHRCYRHPEAGEEGRACWVVVEEV